MDELRGTGERGTPGRVRCAIYTRKSTEEGLEQEFNSLQAQREAGEAYIHSQKELGWTAIQTDFDDGGFSGGNLDRPALQKLLEHIEARQVDCVVVYKVDRLSRSLLDFARLMERFEQSSVSFVSVTQQFNSTTSLGRLTLNILLSFAQFEQELVSERTRDKMSAARRKGKWVGGTPVLGYDVHPAGGRLIVNAVEAGQVGEIFDLYRRHRSLVVVADELNQRGWVGKSWESRQQVRHAGHPFTKLTLRSLLTNATYAGKVHYRGETYAGEHPAIIDEALWEDVNRDLSEAGGSSGVAHQPQQALLAGLVICRHCQQPMIATYSAQGRRRYRYYVCQTARQKGWKACPTKSVSASLLEDSISLQLRAQVSVAEQQPPAPVAASEWIQSRVEQIRYDGPSGMVRVQLRCVVAGAVPESFEYAIPRRRGRALPPFRLRPAQETLTRPPRLARLVALAHKLDRVVRSGRVQDYAELARLAQVSRARIGQIVMLGQLAPAIQERILFLSTEHSGQIAERELLQIARQPRWDHQWERFEQLLTARALEDTSGPLPSPPAQNGRSLKKPAADRRGN